jgi:hypothetical protein
MIEHSPAWTTNLEQLGWSIGEFCAILGVIIYVIERCK